MKRILFVLICMLLLGCLTVSRAEVAELGGKTFDTGAREIRLEKAEWKSFKAFRKQLDAFPCLEKLEILSSAMTPEQIVQLREEKPGLELHVRFRYLNREFSTDDTYAAWPKGSYKIDEIRAFLKAMPNLETLDLTASSSSFSRVETLAEEFPGVQVLHTISIGEHSVKTSATAFSTLGGGDSPRNDEKYFECLRFCPDLLALDLGHQKIRSVDFLRFFPNLKVLILADNKLDSEDLADLVRYCPHLEYLELFMNDIDDLSPLTALTELKDLNIAHNRIADAAPLTEMPWLERCWIAHNAFPEEQRQMLTERLPETQFEFEAWSSTAGWRGEHPHYLAVYAMFHEYRHIPFDE